MSLNPPRALSRPQPDSAEDQAKQRAALRKACRSFEAEYLKLLWKEMRKTVVKSGFLGGGLADDFYTDMLDQAVSDDFVRGGSMGLADMLERQLGRGGRSGPGKGLAEYLRASGALGLVMPVDGVVSSPFGAREHPITGRPGEHHGVDLAAPEGSDIHAARSGWVTFAGRRGDYGNLVILKHADGSSTFYGHCRELKVSAGERVRTGQTVAAVGSTGLSTGPHLHFELRDAKGNPIDPMPRLARGAGRSARGG
jgi:murein DD-endopeptidase MepM/ murein hydrolase activator NlpD